MRKFWNWVRNENKGRTLFLNGPIAEETWWGDEVTPKAFKDELLADDDTHGGTSPITVWVNSPGGDVFAAAQIYNMLKEYPGRVTVQIDAIAASAASVVAMAGDEVRVSPLAQIMIHDPQTVAIGGTGEMDKAKALLDEVKASIINAYQMKTGLSRAKLAAMMTAETWMNAKKAVELGFADKIMYTDNTPPKGDPEALIFSRSAVTNSLLRKLPKPEPEAEPKPKAQIEPTAPAEPNPPAEPTPPLNQPEQSPAQPLAQSQEPTLTQPKTGTPVESLYKRLDLLLHQ